MQPQGSARSWKLEVPKVFLPSFLCPADSPRWVCGTSSAPLRDPLRAG